MRHIDLKTLRLFVSVCDQRNIARAAEEEAHIEPSAISKRVEPSLKFEQTLAHEHVGLPPATAVHTMLQRAAAGAGLTVSYRVIVSSFDAAFRVVAAGLGY